MKFKTGYNWDGNFPSSPSGEKIEKVYQYDAKNHELIEVGTRDINEDINSHFEHSDLNHIIARFENGDTNALNARQGHYADISEAPNNIHELIEQQINLKNKITKIQEEQQEEPQEEQQEQKEGENQNGQQTNT